MEGLRIGTDIEENDRFERLLHKGSFCSGVYTQAEQRYLAGKGPRLAPRAAAGLFCAKEAVAKALGVGLFGLRPLEIEIGHDAAGAPQAQLQGAAQGQFPAVCISLSISHTKRYTTATAVVWGAGAFDGAKTRPE